ncbi:MAG: thioredoxin-disulfide reductase [Lentisphaerae bacterium RIFOXYA12_FULL_48_11]|nr:MAG: thioredoxin-disulfide reductase [Lentisphaerae bacterium RIFOXYA12_FULL_48_11]
MEKVVIIGTGPAGLTAALYSARASLNPLVVDGMQPGGQLTTTSEIENFPGFPAAVTGSELMDKMREQAGRFGARYVMDEVVSVDFSGKTHKVSLSDGTVLESLSVIIATGASAKYLGLESEEKLKGRGVSGCATCDGSFYRNVPVAVVGGGDTAMEDATYLSRLASKVTLIHRRNEFRASKIMADRVMSNPRIDLMLDTVIEEIRDMGRNEVTGLVLKNVKTGAVSELKVTGVFMAIGHKPNTGPFRGQIDMDENGYIITNSTRTNVAGVFAAGDCQDHVYRQAVTAAGTGCMAALESARYLESMGQ